MTKDFSSVTTKSSTARKTATASTETPAWRNPKILALVLAAVVVVGGLSWLFWPTGGGTSKAEIKIGTPHGPRVITNGIPSGYTQDEGGAAAAGANFLQAITRANAGGVDVNKVRETLVVPSPEGTLLTLLDNAKGREKASGQGSNQQPVSLAVSNLNPKEATVTAWGVGLSLFTPPKTQNGAPQQTNVTAVWGTSRVGLLWDADKSTWLVRSYEYKTGPTPDAVTGVNPEDPLVKGFQEGTYTLVVN